MLLANLLKWVCQTRSCVMSARLILFSAFFHPHQKKNRKNREKKLFWQKLFWSYFLDDTLFTFSVLQTTNFNGTRILNCSLYSELFFISMCSIRIRSIFKVTVKNILFRFIQSQNFRTLLELESNGRALTEDDIGRIERGEAIEPKKKDKRKSTFQVCWTLLIILLENKNCSWEFKVEFCHKNFLLWDFFKVIFQKSSVSCLPDKN